MYQNAGIFRDIKAVTGLISISLDDGRTGLLD